MDYKIATYSCDMINMKWTTRYYYDWWRLVTECDKLNLQNKIKTFLGYQLPTMLMRMIVKILE